MHKKNFIIFISIIFLFLSLSTGSVFAIVTRSISAYPTNPSNLDPRSASWFIYSYPAGTTRSDEVTVKNNQNTPVTLKVYAVDSTTTSDGKFALQTAIAPKLGIGKWIKLADNEITLAPKASKVISFTISIPPQVSPGDYSGGIIFENITPNRLVRNGVGINVITRYGVRIYETVPGSNQLNMSVKHFTYQVANNAIVVTFALENNGTVLVSPTGSLVLKNIVGQTITTIPLNNYLHEVMPGKPETISVHTGVNPPFVLDTAKVAIYYSPTKVAVASLVVMPFNRVLDLAILTILLLIFLATTLIYKKYLKKSGHERQTKSNHPHPHVFLIVGISLLLIIAVSALFAALLIQIF